MLQFSFILSPTASGFCVFVILILLWIIRRMSYWKRKGIYQVKPHWFFGNVKEVFLSQKALGQMFLDVYREIKSKDKKHGGIYFFYQPFYVPVDPEIIKHILVKDFDYFMDHGVYFNEKIEPLTGHLFSLEGARWRNLRTKLTPTFTSRNIKNMHESVLNCSEELVGVINLKSINKEAVDIKDILGRFTIDVIGTCAFGIDCNSLKDPNSDFRLYGNKIFNRTLINSLSHVATNILPKQVCTLLGVKVIDKDVSSFFENLVKNNVEYREKYNIFRPDFMHLLLQLNNCGELMKEKDNNLKKNSFEGLTLNEIAAQCFVFFLAGYETSASTMTFALYELALDETMQNKLREEINFILESFGNNFSYEAIVKMSFLEKVVFETLRKYPPLAGTMRICNKKYKIPNSNLTLEKGTRVHIPIMGIQRDSEYYPDPEKFDPERFSEDEKALRSVLTYLPFGEGPRKCIGARFGILQTKIGIANIIRHFKVAVSDNTKTPIEFDPYNFMVSPKGKIWLNLEKI